MPIRFKGSKLRKIVTAYCQFRHIFSHNLCSCSIIRIYPSFLIDTDFDIVPSAQFSNKVSLADKKPLSYYYYNNIKLLFMDVRYNFGRKFRG